MHTENNQNTNEELDLYKEIYSLFSRQRASAKFRGINWNFTFEEWLGLWLASGHISDRGRGSDKYVMARFNDEGEYSPENCFIQTFGDNIREVRNRERKSREQQKGAQ